MEAKTVPVERVPWWRRILRRQPKQYQAGERTSSMRQGTRARGGTGRGRMKLMRLVQWVLGLAVLLGIVGFVAIPSFQQLVMRSATSVVDNVRRIVAPSYTEVHPSASGLVPSDEVDEHPVKQVVDTFRDTDWQAAGDRPSLTVRFDRPVDLGLIDVYSGAGRGFVDVRRPATLRLTFPDGRTVELALEDKHDAQRFTVETSAVDAVRIDVLDTYGPAGTPVAISELVFFAKK